tara:strand:- start:147 stop:278 length:132 start_codon:yes stop_codon:yes gene_type:complete
MGNQGSVCQSSVAIWKFEVERERRVEVEVKIDFSHLNYGIEKK